MFEKIYDPFNRFFRPKRVKLFYDIFDITEETRVLDLGGGPSFWDIARELGKPLPRLTILNLRAPANALCDRTTWVLGDARNAPFEDFSFDIAFSNSLIEHLCDWHSQAALAGEISRLAPNYFVQTPDRHFPIEPHFITPVIHWLPKRAQRLLVRNFTVWGILRRPTREYVERVMAELSLLNKVEVGQLFPDANIVSEKFIGLSKSIVAYRRGV